MTTPDPNMVAAYRRGLARRGIPLKLSRIDGVAPRTATFSVTVTAMVQDALPDTTSVAETGFSTGKVGAITQTQRMLIVMATDLQDQRFPLPLRKHDKATIIDTGEELNIVGVDASKRAIAGAIELKASGVA